LSFKNIQGQSSTCQANSDWEQTTVTAVYKNITHLPSTNHKFSRKHPSKKRKMFGKKNQK